MSSAINVHPNPYTVWHVNTDWPIWKGLSKIDKQSQLISALLKISHMVGCHRGDGSFKTSTAFIEQFMPTQDDRVEWRLSAEHEMEITRDDGWGLFFFSPKTQNDGKFSLFSETYS